MAKWTNFKCNIVLEPYDADLKGRDALDTVGGAPHFDLELLHMGISRPDTEK